MKKKSKLKPCPFCGSPAEIVNDVAGSTTKYFLHSVWCKNCRAAMEGYTSKDDAIIDWNRRAKAKEGK